ncbi:unnamed protein product, partial [Rotaria socialis]
MPRRVLG